ncbi:hypothetical protein NUSPORA_02455 [Nucleospora cyclopteri]
MTTNIKEIDQKEGIQTETPPLTLKEKKKKFSKMIKILKSLPKSEFVLRNTKRVCAFTAVDALKSLSAAGFEAVLIKECFDYMLDEGIVFKVKILQNNVVDVNFKRTFSAADLFIWEKEDNTKIYMFLGLLLTFAICIIMLFKVFPRWHRYVLYYLRYPIIAFFGFMFVSAIVRLIFYLLTLFFCNEQCWIWPNLFADCGFFESFVPAYEWSGTEEKAKED